jgi:hypothetical protein
MLGGDLGFEAPEPDLRCRAVEARRTGIPVLIEVPGFADRRPPGWSAVDAVQIARASACRMVASSALSQRAAASSPLVVVCSPAAACSATKLTRGVGEQDELCAPGRAEKVRKPGLRTIPGAEVFPLYSLPQVANPGYQGQYIGVVSCSVMRQLTMLGQCAPGLAAVQVFDGSLVYSDNPHDSTKPFVSHANPAYTGSLAALPLQAALVRVNNAATLERTRTYLATHAPPQVSAGPGVAATPPRTYGEAVAIRSGRAQVAQKLFDLAVTLTIVVAGCSPRSGPLDRAGDLVPFPCSAHRCAAHDVPLWVTACRKICQRKHRACYQA